MIGRYGFTAAAVVIAAVLGLAIVLTFRFLANRSN
jgi:hypothetical protein